MTIDDILDAAARGYPDGAITDYRDDIDGNHGDTLAQFIVRELREGCEGDDDICDRAIAMMERAANDLSGVIKNLYQLQARSMA